ncbi:hypothetical protein [Sphingopyxis sp. 550A]
MMIKTGLSILAAALAFGAAVPVAAQYTVDTALSDSVLGETRKIGEKPTKSDHMTGEQLAFWRDYCAKWPKGGACDSYRAEAARRAAVVRQGPAKAKERRR